MILKSLVKGLHYLELELAALERAGPDYPGCGTIFLACDDAGLRDGAVGWLGHHGFPELRP